MCIIIAEAGTVFIMRNKERKRENSLSFKRLVILQVKNNLSAESHNNNFCKKRNYSSLCHISPFFIEKCVLLCIDII